MVKRDPDPSEMEEMIRLGGKCFACNEQECYELTEAGTRICPHLQFWNGAPVRRSTLARWRTDLRANAPARRFRFTLPALSIRRRE